jgi:hypothetical protein
LKAPEFARTVPAAVAFPQRHGRVKLMVAVTEARTRGVATALIELSRGESDSSLLVRAGSGDASAWDQLVERHSASVWAAATVSPVGTATAQRIVDLVWLRLRQRLDDPPAPLRPWLLNAVEDAARDVLEPMRRPFAVTSVRVPQLALYPY